MTTPAGRNMKIWLIAGFAVAAFLLLAVRSEAQARSIERAAYDECVIRNANIDKINALYDGFIEIEKTNPFALQGPEEKMIVQRRIDLYTHSMLTKVDCGSAP